MDLALSLEVIRKRDLGISKPYDCERIYSALTSLASVATSLDSSFASLAPVPAAAAASAGAELSASEEVQRVYWKNQSCPQRKYSQGTPSLRVEIASYQIVSEQLHDQS